MILYDIFRYGHGLFYVGLQTFLTAGIFLEWLRDKKALKQQTENSNLWFANQSSANLEFVKVSIIIPVHNESRRMEGLLRTLLVQSYPAQIIFVDDRSTDESPAMLAEFAKDAAARGIDCRIVTLAENPGPNHKQFALSRGIAEAYGDYFLFTDADCEVPPHWVRAMVSRIHNKASAVIAPVFKKRQGKGFFYLYQCYDHIVRYNFLAGIIGLGAAGGGFGNNMIITRNALEAVGGYDAILPSPTEDAALISQVRGIKGCRIRAAIQIDAAVETEPEHSWRSFINQTLRWNNGGLFSPELVTRFNYTVLMLVISTGILAIPLLPFFPSLWPLPVGVLISVMQNAAAVFILFRGKMPKGGFLTKLGYIFAPLLMPFYLTLMTLMGYAGIKPKWKN